MESKSSIIVDHKKWDGEDEVLSGFIPANKDLIQPNEYIRATKGEAGGIRMALNQIHYESIRRAREAAKSEVHIKEASLRKILLHMKEEKENLQREQERNMKHQAQFEMQKKTNAELS